MSKNKICLLDIRSEWLFKASSILDLETRLEETNMPTEARLKTQNILERARKEWGIVFDIINDYEWPDKTTSPQLSEDNSLLQKMKDASNIIWPAIWILAESKNKKVIENYPMDYLLDLDAKSWGKILKELP